MIVPARHMHFLAPALLGTAIASASFTCEAAAPDKRPLYDEVAARIVQTKGAAVVARSVILIADEDAEHYPSAAQLMWTQRPGLSLLHLAGDQLTTIDTLAAENLGVVHESMKRTTPVTKKIKFEGIGLVTDFLARALVGSCFTAYRSETPEKRLVALSTGSERITYQAACDFGAWALAAQGIKIAPDPANPAAVILRPAD